MTYKIDKNIQKLRLLGKEFVKNNKNKGKLIINNKKVPLKDKISIKVIQKNQILMVLNEFINNRSYMFKDCESLVSLTKISLESDSELLKIKEKINQKGFNNNTEEKLEDPDISSFTNYNDINNGNKSNFYDNYFDISNKKWEYSDSLISITSKIDIDLNNSLFLEISDLTYFNNNKNEMNNLFDNNKSLINFCDILMQNTNNNIYSKSNKFLTTSDDISKLNIYNVSNISNMFYNCKSLSKLPDLSKFNTYNVLDMSSVFYNCNSIKSLPDISQWSTDNVINMNKMFYNCSLLKSLPDISIWNTSKVSDLNSIFYNCSSLLFLPDISIWNTSNVSYINNMFYNCGSLSELPDLSKWNIDNVIDMSYIFYNCKSIKFLPDISKWNPHNVYNMNSIFYNCQSLSKLPELSRWNINNVIYMNSMFYNCKKHN